MMMNSKAVKELAEVCGAVQIKDWRKYHDDMHFDALKKAQEHENHFWLLSAEDDDNRHVVAYLVDKMQAEDYRRKEAEYYRRTKGMSIHATFPNGFTLSIQGGSGNYSEPREAATAYEAVEIAVWHRDYISIDDIYGTGYIRKASIARVDLLVEAGFLSAYAGNHTVGGYIDVERLEELCDLVSFLPNDPSLCKSKMKWYDEDSVYGPEDIEERYGCFMVRTSSRSGAWADPNLDDEMLEEIRDYLLWLDCHYWD